MTLPANTLQAQYALIPITPMGKPRPRVRRNGWTFMPREYIAWRDDVALAFGDVALNGPLEVVADFLLPMPASWSNRKRQRMDGVPHAGARPDIDNLLGGLMDALLPHGDGRVVAARARKRWAIAGAIRVVVRAAAGGVVEDFDF